jgi:hypothetical protein
MRVPISERRRLMARFRVQSRKLMMPAFGERPKAPLSQKAARNGAPEIY